MTKETPARQHYPYGEPAEFIPLVNIRCALLKRGQIWRATFYKPFSSMF